MKLVFAGTPEFAALALKALIQVGHEIALVLTRTDKPAGRGQQLTASPVKQLAQNHGIAVLQPRTLKPGLRDEAHVQALKDTGAQAMIVAAYGLILPSDVLMIPPLGCLNIHASLLPRWRGAAPIQRAIEAGDAQTGITIMQMDVGLDTGAMRLIKPLAISPTDTAASLHDALATLGAQAIVEALALLSKGQLASLAQPEQGVCMAARIEKSESPLDWSQSARALERKVRALNPSPGCSAVMRGVPLKIWSAQAIESVSPDPKLRTWQGASEPGTVVALSADHVVIATGEGLLSLHELQKPGGKRLAIKDFLGGWPMQLGQTFE